MRKMFVIPLENGKPITFKKMRKKKRPERKERPLHVYFIAGNNFSQYRLDLNNENLEPFIHGET